MVQPSGILGEAFRSLSGEKAAALSSKDPVSLLIAHWILLLFVLYANDDSTVRAATVYH